MKFLKPILSILIIFGWISITLASTTSGLSYLRTKQASDGTIGGIGVTGWVVMAFAMNGEQNNHAVDALKQDQVALSTLSTTDIEKQILALVAAGENPRTFAGHDAVAALRTRITQNQFGDPDLLNDDIFGLLAFQAANEPVNQASVQKLISHQNTDGGWGIATSGGSSTDMTAVALIALKDFSVDSSITEKGLAYIKTRQNDDGGFATVSGASSLGSTTWVDWMIVSLGLPYVEWQKNNRTPRDYIWAQQSADGSWQNSTLLTSYALIATSQKGFPYRSALPVASPSPSPMVTVAPTPTPHPSVSVSPTPSPSSTPNSTNTPSFTPSVSPSPDTSPVITDTVVAQVPVKTTSPKPSIISQVNTTPQSTISTLPQAGQSEKGSFSPTPTKTFVPLVDRVKQAEQSNPIFWHLGVGGMLLGINTGSTFLEILRARQKTQ